jgi:photosystem II reaction center protein PsbP
MKIMKAKTVISFAYLLVLWCVLFQIHIFEISNAVAQPGLSPIPIQVKTAVPSIGNPSAKTSMRPYVNPLNGISMLYPSDWQSSVAGLSYPELIKFYSPLHNFSDFMPAQITVAVTKYENNGITLTQYTDFALTLLNKSQQQKQLVVDSSNPVMVGGNPGHKVTFSIAHSSNMTSDLRTMETWTVVNDKLYVISFFAEPMKFNRYLPQVTQVLNSLRISGDATSFTTGTSGNSVVDKIVSLCKQHQTLCGAPICSSVATSMGVNTTSCMHALPAVRAYFNSHRNQ